MATGTGVNSINSVSIDRRPTFCNANTKYCLLLAAVLYNLYTKCLNTLKSCKKNFQEFDKCIDSELTDKWKAIDARPQKKNKEVLSVHMAKFKDGGFSAAIYSLLI